MENVSTCFYYYAVIQIYVVIQYGFTGGGVIVNSHIVSKFQKGRGGGAFGNPLEIIRLILYMSHKLDNNYQLKPSCFEMSLFILDV